MFILGCPKFLVTVDHKPDSGSQATGIALPNEDSSQDDADNITKAAVNAVRYRYDNDAVLRAITWDRIRAVCCG